MKRIIPNALLHRSLISQYEEHQLPGILICSFEIRTSLLFFILIFFFQVLTFKSPLNKHWFHVSILHPWTEIDNIQPRGLFSIDNKGDQFFLIFLPCPLSLCHLLVFLPPSPCPFISTTRLPPSLFFPLLSLPSSSLPHNAVVTHSETERGSLPHNRWSSGGEPRGGGGGGREIFFSCLSFFLY